MLSGTNPKIVQAGNNHFRVSVVHSRSAVRSPIVNIARTSFMYIKFNNIWIVAATRTNANVAMIFTLLNKILKAMQGTLNVQGVVAYKISKESWLRSTRNMSRIILSYFMSFWMKCLTMGTPSKQSLEHSRASWILIQESRYKTRLSTVPTAL